MSVRSQASVSSNDQVGKKLLDSLQADLRVISNECKKRMPQIKEVNNRCLQVFLTLDNY